MRDAVKMKTSSARLISDGPSNLHPGGRRAVFTYSTNRHGKFNWEGTPKHQRLVLAAEDLAGNRSTPVRVSD